MFSARQGFFSLQEGFGNSGFWGSGGFGTDVRRLYTTNTSTSLLNWSQSSGFTVEYWQTVPTSTSGSINLGVGNSDVNGFTKWSFGFLSTGKVQFYADTVNGIVNIRTQNVFNQWRNICMVTTTSGSNTTITIYVNGIREVIDLNNDGNFTDSKIIGASVIDLSTPLGIGSTTQFNLQNTYVDNLRISNVARYSGASYTLANKPFTVDADTQLYLIMDGANGSTSFPDSSTFNRTIQQQGSTNLVVVSDTRKNHT